LTRQHDNRRRHSPLPIRAYRPSHFTADCDFSAWSAFFGERLFNRPVNLAQRMS